MSQKQIVKVVGSPSVRFPEILQITLDERPEDETVRNLIDQGWVNYKSVCDCARQIFQSDPVGRRPGDDDLLQHFGILMFDPDGSEAYTYILECNKKLRVFLRNESPPDYPADKILIPTKWAKTVLSFMRSGVTRVIRLSGEHFRLGAGMTTGKPMRVLKGNGNWLWALRNP